MYTAITDICIRNVTSFPAPLYKVILTGQHVDVSTVRDGEDVRWHFITPLATVQFGTPESVDRVTLVGVDGHAEEAGVGLQRVSKYCYTNGDRNGEWGHGSLPIRDSFSMLRCYSLFPTEHQEAHKNLR